MRLHFNIAAICSALLLIALNGCALSRGEFSVATARGTARPSVQTVFSEAEAFALRRGFVREPRAVYDGSLPPMGKPVHTGYEQRKFSFSFEPNNAQPSSPGIVLDIFHWQGSSRVGFSLYGTYNGRYQKAIDQFRRDYYREFAGRYGAGSISEASAYPR